jgi:hypothetical protein
MRIALHTVVSASKKEPLNELVGRVRKAFLDAGLGEPSIRFTLTDAARVAHTSRRFLSGCMRPSCG